MISPQYLCSIILAVFLSKWFLLLWLDKRKKQVLWFYGEHENIHVTWNVKCWLLFAFDETMLLWSWIDYVVKVQMFKCIYICSPYITCMLYYSSSGQVSTVHLRNSYIGVSVLKELLVQEFSFVIFIYFWTPKFSI